MSKYTEIKKITKFIMIIHVWLEKNRLLDRLRSQLYQIFLIFLENPSWIWTEDLLANVKKGWMNLVQRYYNVSIYSELKFDIFQ